QSKYKCTSCGYEANADYNAAKNILAAGLAVTACGASKKLAAKQEPACGSLC
ncbi:MAG: transposase, partial [Alphaproteobacteria bacterium]|nr:transposase [Alphaproteobacteria bacterium]